MKTGRKLAIVSQPTLIREICQLLEQGCSIRTTCQAVGFSESCFFDCLQRANPKASDYDPRCAEFSERVTRARGKGKARLVGLVSDAAANDWHAAIALLERLASSEYGRAPQHVNGSSWFRPDAGTIQELLSRAQASSNPDTERLERLRLTLQEVQKANEELFLLLDQWNAENSELSSLLRPT